jgi:universal stress protein A
VKNYQSMLFASDLSPESDVVGKQALQIAKRVGATLSIVHVFAFVPMTYGGVEFAVPMDASVKEELVQQAKQRLQEQAAQLQIPLERQWLPAGIIKSELIDIVKNENIDVIMVGAHSHHGLAILLGSTADSLLHAMPCDVLALHLK